MARPRTSELPFSLLRWSTSTLMLYSSLFSAQLGKNIFEAAFLSQETWLPLADQREAPGALFSHERLVIEGTRLIQGEVLAHSCLRHVLNGVVHFFSFGDAPYPGTWQASRCHHQQVFSSLCPPRRNVLTKGRQEPTARKTLPFPLV